MTLKNSVDSRSFWLSILGLRGRGTGALALGVLASALAGAACLPTEFTFEETGVGGSLAASSASAGGATGTGGTPDPCGSGSQCDAPPPEGWQGYFVVTLDVFPSSSFVGCPSGAKPLEYFASPSPATCEGCSCKITGTTCSAASLACYYMNNACTESASATAENGTAGCSDFTALPPDENLSGSCQLMSESSVVLQGTCAAGTSGLVEPDPWGETIFACPLAPAVIECGPNLVCVEKPPPGAHYICIAKPGEDACPDGFVFSSEIQAFEGGVDARACDSCDCGPISCTNGAFEIYDGLACNDADNPVVAFKEPGCEMLSEYFDSGTASVKTIPPSPVAECLGGAGAGLVETTGPMKFCCK